jgi:hypothetical protein
MSTEHEEELLLAEAATFTARRWWITLDCDVAHFYPGAIHVETAEGASMSRSLCGRRQIATRFVLSPGSTWPRCKMCERMLAQPARAA